MDRSSTAGAGPGSELSRELLAEIAKPQKIVMHSVPVVTPPVEIHLHFDLGQTPPPVLEQALDAVFNFYERVATFGGLKGTGDVSLENMTRVLDREIGRRASMQQDVMRGETSDGDKH